MTTPLYLPEPEKAYQTEFDAEVVKAKKDAVVLDETLFYATGGGQPNDTGTLRWDGGEARVTDVSKKGEWRHVLKGSPPAEGAPVHGEIDWARRHALMRMHTAQHVISAVVFDAFEATTCGNNISEAYSRVDFEVDGLTDDQLEAIESRCNDIFDDDVEVLGYEEDRDRLEARIDPRSTLMHLIPKSIKVLRVVEVPNIDITPCAGTHVKSTGEIGRMRILRTENKGADRTRVVYELTGP